MVWQRAHRASKNRVMPVQNVGSPGRTFGGTLTMAYTPDNSETAFDIRFMSPPVVVSTGPLSYSVVVDAEEDLNQ